MPLVKDLKHHKPAEGRKEFWSFHLLLELDGTPLESIGWKYFPGSGRVQPPAAKMGKFWVPTIRGVIEDVEVRIRAACEKAIGPEREADWLKKNGANLRAQAKRAIQEKREEEFLGSDWAFPEAAARILEEERSVHSKQP